MTRWSEHSRRLAHWGGVSILLLGLASAVGFHGPEAGGAGAAASQDAESRDVTVFLLRHAEKGTDDARDPSLSEAGRARALEIARLFGAAGVTHLFSTDYKRTRQTLAPLAEATGLEIVSYDPRKAEYALRGLPDGAIAVVAGHSNTTPGLFSKLSEREAVDLEDSAHGKLIPDGDYDRLYGLSLRGAASEDGGSEVAHWDCVGSYELRYGAPSTD